MIFHVLFVPKNPICPCCSHNENYSKGSKERKLRMAPLGNKMAFLLVKLHRLQCINCRHTWWPPLPFAKPKVMTPFLLQLKEKAVQLKAMAMDMNAAYASAAKKYLPNVDIVFDRFHVVALLNTAIDEIRRDQQAKCNEIGLKAIKGMRFLLLRNYEKLDLKKKNSLECLLEVNQPIALAHAMKEQIRLFWTKQTVEERARFLAWWIM